MSNQSKDSPIDLAKLQAENEFLRTDLALLSEKINDRDLLLNQVVDICSRYYGDSHIGMQDSLNKIKALINGEDLDARTNCPFKPGDWVCCSGDLINKNTYRYLHIIEGIDKCGVHITFYLKRNDYLSVSHISIENIRRLFPEDGYMNILNSFKIIPDAFKGYSDDVIEIEDYCIDDCMDNNNPPSSGNEKLSVLRCCEKGNFPQF